MGTQPQQSYRDLDPLEQGGRTARDGFDYQDHVAVNKCLDMLLPDGPQEVWCEAEDDLVLVWLVDGKEEFEFVQVKGTDIEQAWTVSILCRAETGKDGKKKPSIVQKSLAHDRGLESCRFRLVTRWQPDKFLNVLQINLDKRSEPAIRSRLKTAATKLPAPARSWRSQNGHGVEFWIERTTWEHRASTKDIKNENLLKLNRVLDIEGLLVAPDQLEELHAKLCAKVKEASLSDGVTQRKAKRLLQNELRDWLRESARVIRHPTHSGSTAPLERKLKEAGVDRGTIDMAVELRRKYIFDRLKQKYLTLDEREMLENDVNAILHRLKTQLDAGELHDNGREFLNRCLGEIRRLQGSNSGSPPSEGVSYGYFYEVMNRCLHRLQRVSP